MYSPDAAPPKAIAITPVKAKPIEIQTALSINASRGPTSWALRWMTKMSNVNKTQMKTKRATQAQPGTFRSTKLAFPDSEDRKLEIIKPD
jgi:hypothetical protein